ncbi:MAG: cysteine hydrolase family protein [Chloroflexi bacterium]|nr:cysteine hydrolase family protein [Chloroflexota bacterium]
MAPILSAREPSVTATDDFTALLIIDVQEGLDEPRLGARNNPAAESNMARLLTEWRARKRPVFHVQHMSAEPDSPLRPERPGNAIKREVAPIGDEPVIQKTVNAAFIGTDLRERLLEAGIESLVIIGLTTDHCVSSTARMAGDLGFRVIVVADATAAHERLSYDGARHSAETVHELALANLYQEFATILTTDQVLGMH